MQSGRSVPLAPLVPRPPPLRPLLPLPTLLPPPIPAEAAPEVAAPLYQHVVHKLEETNGIGCVKNGMFGEHMQVELVNDGPVTIMLERAPLPPHQQC